MSKLSVGDVTSLVAKAFCLEAIADKTDCTGRHVDLPDRPLEGFIVAGINSSLSFADFAKSRYKGSKSVYSHYVDALKASNKHKSQKYVNFGLLEIMFPVVAARLLCKDPKKVVKTINSVLSSGTSEDVTEMLNARKTAWSTSKNPQKNAFEYQKPIADASSPADFYQRILEHGRTHTSSMQWVEQYEEDWPLLQQMFDGLQDSQEPAILDRITSVFNPIREKNEDVRIGILADMCAAAIFLHLSFRD